MSKYPHVYKPITIRGVYYKNRIALAPPGCAGLCDENGFVTPEFVKWFEVFAKGGAAVVNIGNCSIDLLECNDEGGQMELKSDLAIAPLSTFAQTCSLYGAHGQLEVNHCGATQGNVPGTAAGENGFAPSPIITDAERVRAEIAGREPIPLREMSRQKIQETVQKFANAARIIKAAGMKTMLFHGAHGNLLAQFFSPYFNRRSDEYGGSAANRARFAVEVLDAARKAVGEDFVIEYRISADEFAEGHVHFHDTIEFIDIIKDKIDILHVSAGLHDTQGRPEVMRPMVQPYMFNWMYNVHFASDIKKLFPKLYITTVGSIKSIAQAEEIIASGKADFVAMMRAMLADPDMPRKYAQGREIDHRPCIRCACVYMDKHGSFSGPCSVNPFYGRHTEFPEGSVPRAPVSKKAAVIGAGPAGIQAMLTLIQRGHDVTLYEKSDKIGGNVINAALLPVKKDIASYLDYLNAQARHCGAKILLNTEAAPELIANERFDSIIVAIGADPIVPDVPGIDKPLVRWAPESVDMDGLHKVVIVGAGAIGIEYAIHFAGRGVMVTLVELAGDITIKGSSSGVLGGEFDLRNGLTSKNIDLRLRTKLVSVSDNSVTILQSDTGEYSEIPTDAVLLAVGMKPRFTDGQAFRHCAPETEVFLVGDCLDTNEIRGAVRSAFNIAAYI